MKINIKNLLFQPLALHLLADGEGLHLTARECKEILTEHISEEIQRAAARGFVSLVGKIVGKSDRASISDSGVSTPESVEPVDKPRARSKKGRGR